MTRSDLKQHEMASQPIVAFATAPGRAALALLRLSGPMATTVLGRCFRPYRRFPVLEEMTPYSLAVGRFCDENGEILDEVVLSCFRAPHSYTGEDMYEISCHGGLAVRESLLEALLAAGARLARPGEFTELAFLNGKLDLNEAEAVMDLIDSEAREQERLAVSHLQGLLGQRVKGWEDDVYGLLARLELMLEFPDEEDFEAHKALLKTEFARLRTDFESLLATYGRGKQIREGFRLVLAGAPNAGKSSLLNCLLGRARAIVSDIPGTTRDVLEERLLLDGRLCLLYDVAGLRESDDPIEAEGVRRAHHSLAEADLILYLLPPELDLSVETQGDFEEIRHWQACGKRLILLQSKDDLYSETAAEAHFRTLLNLFPEQRLLRFSTRRPACLEALQEAILAELPQLTAEQPVLLANQRQASTLEAALVAFREAENTLEAGWPLELVASTLRTVLDSLGELSGQRVDETLVSQIFSRFCVGK